ncbi:MAG: replication-associated recombination protein A [Lactovum sp.]
MNHQNLAARMRPRILDEVLGQEHLIGDGKIIRRMIETELLSSMILYGPPGTGKTSIAFAISTTLKLSFRTFNATVDNKKKLQEIAEEAKSFGTLLLLLDEIHRLTKPLQDFLLPLLENGEIILIGATTENPYFSVLPAIRSRVQIFEVKALEIKDLEKAVQLVLSDSKRAFDFDIKVEDKAIQFLVHSTNGDLRALYNSLELAILSSKNHQVSLSDMENSLQKKAMTFDKDGDSHYDLLSALQKSIRGSDVNASLHYAARLIEGGDLLSLSRRLTVIAYEDIGLANPSAQIHTVTALNACEKIGFPEARILISQIVIDLALSPKSNTAVQSIDQALKDLHQHGNLAIPAHLQDGHYAGAEDLGRAQSYLYPHDYAGHWVNQQYLPDKLKNANYFSTDGLGKYERALIERKKWIDQQKEK